MFYQPGKEDHGLPYDPFKACVIPRPIGWISTLSPTTGAANLAPYSQFNNLTFDPPLLRNAEATGVFCWNLATYPLREAVNASAEQVPYGVDEFERAGLEKEDSKLSEVSVGGKASGHNKKVPMVKQSPVKFECQHYTTLRLPGNPPMGAVDVVIGKVVGIHIDEGVLTEGKIDVKKTEPIARCGYHEYTVVREVFEMRIPGGDAAILKGLEGSAAFNREMDCEKSAGEDEKH